MSLLQEKFLRILVLILIILLLAIPTGHSEEKHITDDRVSATKLTEPAPSDIALEMASAEINNDLKKHKAIMGAGVAAAAVGAVYVGGHNWSDLQNKVGVDRVAHFGVSYIICDQLQAAGMNKFWATTTTIAIGAAKEKWVDNKWDNGDFTADCLGALVADIKF